MSEQPPVAPPAQAQPGQGIAITALITGLLGLVLSLIFLFTDLGPSLLWAGLILGIVGLITGIIALKKKQSKGMAVTGLIAGVITILAALALIIFTALLVSAFVSALA